MAETQLLEIKNLDQVLAVLGPKLLAGPVREMFLDICVKLENDARHNAPYDTGKLHGSITHLVDPAEFPEWAIVGTNLFYAPFLEYGTGIFADGDPAFKSARVMMGGIMPRRYMRNALDDNQSYIQEQVNACGDAIGAIWEAAGE